MERLYDFKTEEQKEKENFKNNNNKETNKNRGAAEDSLTVGDTKIWQQLCKPKTLNSNSSTLLWVIATSNDHLKAPSKGRLHLGIYENVHLISEMDLKRERKGGKELICEILR